ncbi:Holliday junction resolvase RuvX [Myxococcota bacterium]|nr:Holliday junction resolvase RuvX [Myxococcota bacterium]
MAADGDSAKPVVVPKGPMLGVDPGTKRIGFALSDSLGMLAAPLEVWTRKKSPAEDVARVVRHVKEHEVVAVVVGVPYNMDGSKGPSADKALAFIAQLRPAMPAGVPVLERDEALTSWAAEERMKELGLGPEERRGKVDMYAAAVILQEELDARWPKPPRPRVDEDDDALD